MRTPARRIPTCLLGILAGVALNASLPVAAATISLSPQADTSLFEYEPTFNLGAEADVPVGTLAEQPAEKARSRLLIRFDLTSALPPDAIIEFAELELTVTKTPPAAVPSAFTLHRMLQPWNEGAGNGPRPGGSPAQAGSPSWNARSHPDNPWSRPGGEADQDFAPDIDAEERIRFPDTYHFELTTHGLETLQDWLGSPNSNHGWILKTSAEETAQTARRVATREHPQSPPRLHLDLTLPQPKWSVIRLENQSLHLEFIPSPGIQYQIQSRPNLLNAPWQTTSTIPPRTQPTIDPVTFTEPFEGSPQRFYRIVASLPPPDDR